MSELARVLAPELPAGATWINTDRPISLASLRGRVVLLDFWTSGCVNCLNALPVIERLERRFGQALRVIGVHSAKFPSEKLDESVRRATRRHRIRHAVVSDPEHRIADAYAVSAWPTLVLVDPGGYIVGGIEGEPDEDELAREIEQAAARSTVPIEPPGSWPAAVGETVLPGLRFPGKLLADAATDTLFVSDTGNHRVVIASLQGEVRAVAGCGEAGHQDGDLASARFRDPQGLALLDGVLYLADSGNHALRRIDLAAGQVDTAICDPSFRSPWDVVALVTADPRRFLFVATAASHQIWILDLDTGSCEPFAGTGTEGLIDASRGEALFAQPSGLAVHRRWLFVADSEASALRCIDLEAEADEVSTAVGHGLFEWGDTDGDWEKARLQHPLGLAASGPVVYVADTYNHKIKAVGLLDRTVTTLETGAALCEPGGLAIAGRRLYVADTGNHAVRILDLDSGDLRLLALAL